MKVKIFTRVLIIALVVAIILPILSMTISATRPKSGRKWKSEEIQKVTDYIDKQIKEDKASQRKERQKNAADSLEAVKDALPNLISYIKGASNGGDFDTHAMLDAVTSLCGDICSAVGTFFPVVAIVGAAVNLVYGLIMSILGGEGPDSDISQMEARLSESLGLIQDTLYVLEDRIDELSEQINESTNRIINELTTVMDNADAKRYVRTFMLGVDGNFSYNQYRNYLVGATTENHTASTAYYAQLVAAQKNGASSKEIKMHYDRLYKAIVENENYYYSYLVGTDNGMGKSVVQYYYDVLSARPELIENEESNAAIEAILFAYDLYCTELAADELKLMCNSYQYAYMLVNDMDVYYYGNDADDFVTRTNIEGNDDVNSTSVQIDQRINDIEIQLVRDLVYVLDLTSIYLVEDEDGNVYEVKDSGDEGFGNVAEGQTVYIGLLPEKICDKFSIDTREISYVLNVDEKEEGVFQVDEDFIGATAKITYRGNVIETMTFKRSDKDGLGFDGGSGVKSDPYLISNPSQFELINKGLDKHYKLIKDIDFDGTEINPIGFDVNQNGTEVYTEFTGSLDGNGHTVKNLKIVGGEKTGVFGALGAEAIVKSIKFENVTVIGTIEKATRSDSQYFAGVVAGESYGEISNVEISSCKVSLTVVNQKLEGENRCITSMAGGVVGMNCGMVSACVVRKTDVSVNASHDFGGNDTERNKLSAYAGGICGANAGLLNIVVVSNDTKVSANAKAVYNHDTTVNPYVSALAGGITAEVYGADYLGNVKNAVCNAETVVANAELDCQSNWGEHYSNWEEKNHAYIPGYNETELDKIKGNADTTGKAGAFKPTYVVDYTYGKKNENGEYLNSIYAPGSREFLLNDLKFTVNGKECVYEIIDVYGFDTNNLLFEDVKENVIVLFKAYLEEGEVYLTKEIPIKVQANYLIEKKVIGLKNAYLKGTFVPNGLIVQSIYAVGEPSTIILDNTAKASGELSQYGEIEVTILYGNEFVVCKINIVCDHDNIISDSNKKDELSVAATCYSAGKDAYMCPNCDFVEYVYRSMTEHKPSANAVAPTCTSEGNTGKVVCTNEGCGMILINGKVIPKLTHAYEYTDNGKHTCKYCKDEEYHHYSIEESTRLLDNENGAKEWYVVYTYTCSCKTADGKCYTDEKIDKTTAVDENTKLPSVVVSNGYVLSGGDEVVVYVQLVNNPGGINGAAFGIRYSQGLELVKVENGNIFAGSLISSDGEVNYGYNFVRAKGGEFVGDGNLLKLTFKVTDSAALGASYEVDVVYGMRKTADGKIVDGGFSISGMTDEQCFVTKSGTIKVVEHLPGDVNCDGVVNLLDAMEIAKFMTTDGYELDEKYANVDLSHNVDNEKSNIGLNDIVTILQVISGGYRPELELRDQSFEIILNTGDPEQVLKNINVSIYGENNVYGDAGLVNLERDGYEFLGWYDKMYGGNRVDITDDVKYNKDQKKQTLYAQWELNTIEFERNGATNEITMAPIYYKDGTISVPTEVYSKNYPVLFVTEDKFDKNQDGTLSYALEGWDGSNGEFYETIEQAVADLKNGHYGKVILTPKWSESPTLDFPNWHFEGYEDTVEWYCDLKDPSTKIQPGVDNGKITNYQPVNGKYRVYSKHKLITFTIKFDDNTNYGYGQSIFAKECSIEKPIDLSTVTVNWDGHNHSGWSYNGAIFGKNESVGYVSGVKSGETITLSARWGLTPYTIKYKYNFANSSSTAGQAVSETFLYDIENVGNFDKLGKTTHNHQDYGRFYRIKSWSIEGTDLSFATVQEAKNYFSANPQDATIVANWDMPTVYTNYQETISASCAIIDWRNFTGSGTMKLNGVNEVYFIGNAGRLNNLSIEVYAGSPSAPCLYFENFNTKGHIYPRSGSAKIDLILNVSGTNLIDADTSAGTVYGFSSLQLEGNGQIKFKSGCHGNGELLLVSVGEVRNNSNCKVQFELNATNTIPESGNGYTFAGWSCNGVKCSSDAVYVGDGIANINKRYTAAWYSPLVMITQMYHEDDFLQIGGNGAEERRYAYASGGSGTYEYSYWTDVEGVVPSYSYSEALFTLTKSHDTRKGIAVFFVYDPVVNQTAHFTVDWTTTDGCFTGDTLVNLADGSYARLDSLNVGDVVLSWNAFTGEFEAMPISILWNHGENLYNLLKLNFANGKTVKVVTVHGFFDSTLNKYVYINSDNYGEYIGHKFAFMSDDGSFEDVELVSVEHTEEITSCYSLQTACNENVIVEGFLTLTPEDFKGFLDRFEFGENYMYDKEKMEADIAQYGLYTYEEWEDHLTYEEFVALNGQYMKIGIGKGYFTVDDILRLLAEARETNG